jgi:superfamily II DNA/RNA helicase
MTAKEEFENEINAVESNTGLDFFLDDKKTDVSKTDVSKTDVSKRKKYVNTKFISDELTSRKDSGEIPNILKKLEITLGNNPLDYLLCTNMLSVGVDIQRLGMMIVNGQPKNHSEYIQSTGRIGRKYPGLILTIYNSLKPRDLSHYENFRLYHSAFFKYVEPISITPFSARSRDTGLFAVCVGMIRNMVPLVDRDPANFNRNVGTIRDAINEIKSEFSKRVSDTDNKQREQTLLEIDEYMETWENLASQSTDENKLKWKKTGYETESQLKTSTYLLVNVEHGDDSIDGIPKTPMSLRDAEQLHNVYFYESPLDDSEEEDLSDKDKDVDELMGDKK